MNIGNAAKDQEFSESYRDDESKSPILFHILIAGGKFTLKISIPKTPVSIKETPIQMDESKKANITNNSTIVRVNGSAIILHPFDDKCQNGDNKYK